MDREQAKDIVKEYLGDYLNSKNINIRKPFNCLNPEHNDKHPSMSYDKKRQRCKCFSCGVSYDIFNLIAIDYGLNENIDIFNKAYEIYGIKIDKQQSATTPKAAESKPAPKQKEKLITDYMDYYKQKAAALSGSPAAEYLRKRGISEEVANKYMLGYDKEYKTYNLDQNKQQAFCTWQGLIIPTSATSFVVRNIQDAEHDNRHRKSKGNSHFFNGKALYTAVKPIFIVEGAMDALSIIEADGEAVGLCGCGITQLINNLKEKPANQPLILALDQDEAGKKAEDALAGELEALKIPFYRYNPYGVMKDANEALIADKDVFTSELRSAERMQEEMLEAAAEAVKQEYLSTNAAEHLKDFLDGITNSVNTPAISTGFDILDKVLDGGLYEGLYIIGAISSLGKTTLALQIMDQLAQNGQDVLIFSLEMARSELIAKSISRLTYLNATDTRHAKTTRGITAGARYKNYSSEEKALINTAIGKYREYAQHIFIHEGIGDIGIEKVKEVVQQHISITGNKPVVLIDYLQIMAPYDMRSTDKQNTDKAVLELKRLSRDCKIPVIGISSFNRDSYKEGSTNKGKVSQSDFKESGAIEYSADILIGLEFAAAGSKNYNEKEEKKKNPRDIRLVIMKNRNGKAWESVNFKYYQVFNYYEENTGEFTPAEEHEDIFAKIRQQQGK